VGATPFPSQKKAGPELALLVSPKQDTCIDSKNPVSQGQQCTKHAGQSPKSVL
jgi:hypothetical protein